ncbi:DUF3784 domain-containing protein [uncultured Bacteroides sp.]|jgi:hypothetical protein BACCOPRO_00763|uniref:DUF3784 domain-containing protein n=1 Tax=uncultured Bacteroides sp. TaxID=162156 RepID=UPI00280AAB26|nr:DUF3784 domain-containing protein [uncultured Bacteroides sp.]
MDAYIGFQAAFLIVVGLLVRRFPILMAGYNTMTPEQKKHVDAKGAARYLCRALCIIALAEVVFYYILTFAGVTGKLVSIVTTTVIPLVGIVITLIKIQKFGRNTKK